jgi:signal transduction histidine kinase
MFAASPTGVVPVGVALVVVWALVALWLLGRARQRALAGLAALVAVTGAVALAAADADAQLEGIVLGVLAAEVAHLVAALPDGRVPPRRGSLVVAAYVLGAAGGALAGTGDAIAPLVLVATIAVTLALGLRIANLTYRSAGPADRRRIQWAGWALLVIGETALVLVALRLLSGWPEVAAAVGLAATVVLPVSLVSANLPRSRVRVDVLVARTVSLAGLTVLVIGAYVAVVVALDRGIRDDERALLVLSMLAAVVAGLVYALLRDNLTELTNQVLYGERSSPDDSLRTWSTRLTRAIPLDELLLQLAESLRSSMDLRSAEVFTGLDGRYELAAGVPHRDAAAITVGAKERAVVARAGVSGGTWVEVWLPQLADSSRTTRVAPIAHGGELLGLIVVTRPLDADAYDEDEDRVLAELARQVGLALHNIQLDSALQASLDELRRANQELLESRLRIVSAGDDERRRIERNLHDGAQQHLVAMAVKLRIAEELVEDDPPAAVKAIEDLRGALQDTIAELRALAHGIFPPLLASGGLREALPAAAGRSPLLTTVDADGVGRFTPEIEATVYFCCLEAMQNAAKHAGDDAELVIDVHEDEGRLRFAVRDDGPGFDTTLADGGHGFVNMRDRLGAVGGQLAVESAPGRGTVVRGEIPLGA